MAAVDTGLWQRVQLAVLGALAGFAAYALIEDRAHFAAEPQIYLVAVSFGTVFFGTILALIGQMRIWRAAGSPRAASCCAWRCWPPGSSPSRWMKMTARWCADGFCAAAPRRLALILPVLAVLGALGLRQQVLRDGWTPWSLASVLTTAVALGYGAIYAGAVIWPGPWRARVRRGNIVMALLVILIAALWMTPVLNAPKIAAQDILARYTSGRIPGRAGRSADAAL